MKDVEWLSDQPTKSAVRRLKRRARKQAKREQYLAKTASFRFLRSEQLRLETADRFALQEARRLILLERQQTEMSTTLARSAIEFCVMFPGYDHVDLVCVRAYMLGERHDCKPLPLVLGGAVGNYRRDLLARQLKTEPDTLVVRELTTQQLDEVTKALIGHFEDLVEVSDGLRNCAEWHPQCRSTNDHARTRRHSQSDRSRRWQKNVLLVYIRRVGLSAIEELYSYVQIPLPVWLRKFQKIQKFQFIA